MPETDDNFQRWFAGSRVVDAAGAPLVVYHGTNRVFEAFEHGKDSRHPLLSADDNGLGFFFTANPGRKSDSGLWSGAAGFAGVSQADGEMQVRDNALVMPVFLSLQCPHVEKDFATYLSNVGRGGYKEKLEVLGYDGIQVGDIYVAFDATQIKSAIGNSGVYDPQNPDIADQRVTAAQEARAFLKDRKADPVRSSGSAP